MASYATLYRPQYAYNLGNLGSNYGDKLEFLWNEAGTYNAAFQVVLGSAFNLQGVDPGWYNWIFMNGDPSDPTLVQTVQIIFANSMPPVFWGRRALAKTGVVGTFSAWSKILQWNGAGLPLTG